MREKWLDLGFILGVGVFDNRAGVTGVELLIFGVDNKCIFGLAERAVLNIVLVGLEVRLAEITTFQDVLIIGGT